MAIEAFEKRLREFFEEYDQKKLKLVPKIAKKLHRHEELIMNHLHQKYNTGMARNVSEEELREEDRLRREKEGEGGAQEAEEEASEEETAEASAETEAEEEEVASDADEEADEEDEEEEKKS